MFRKILIANRGEIACRIARTARRMGVRTVAVYSHADRGALHTRAADDAIEIGASAPAQSYLHAEKILHAAMNTGAEAVHPGYGFLAENARFAESCARAGLVFIGPSPRAIRDMGDKTRARKIMQRAGVPPPPGWQGGARAAELRAAAARVGYPLLLKAAAGGGGVGMRKVTRAEDFDAALHAARREATSAFADARIYIEKFLPRARHIEVQIFADAHGNAVHLFDRDCSAQRRRQKVVEEAPAPRIAKELRDAMTQAALTAARAIKYCGAGTVEFLLAPAHAKNPKFYFLEMNTRLQVEHAVTEMITGCDLVEWQLRAAAGEPLPRMQKNVRARGHAIEARICAENPAKHFLPGAGKVSLWREGAARAWRRLDSGIAQGDSAPAHYDSLMAKLIVHAPSREIACARLQKSLGEMDIAGVPSNLDFLQAVVGAKEFCDAQIDTEWLAQNHDALCVTSPPSDAHCAVAALCVALRKEETNLDAQTSPETSQETSREISPWVTTRAWQLNLPARALYFFAHADGVAEYCIEYERAKTFGVVDGARMQIAVTRLPNGDARGTHLFQCGARAHAVTIARAGEKIYTRIGARRCELTPRAHAQPSRARNAHAENANAKNANAKNANAQTTLTAPMPAVIAAVHARAGGVVDAGAPLLTLEAMKMEHTLHAPMRARVVRMPRGKGRQVTEGEILAELAAV